MSGVVDASVLVAALVDAGPAGQWAERVLADVPLFAPELLLVEAANVLRRLEKARQIGTPQADAAQEELVRLPVTLFPYHQFADRIWSLRHNLTLFDAWYVALAESLNVPLATLDKRLAKAPGVRCRFAAMRALE